MLIGSEGNLCIAIAHSSFTTDGPTIKPIVYSGFLGCMQKQTYHAIRLGLFDVGYLVLGMVGTRYRVPSIDTPGYRISVLDTQQNGPTVH